LIVVIHTMWTTFKDKSRSTITLS